MLWSHEREANNRKQSTHITYLLSNLHGSSPVVRREGLHTFRALLRVDDVGHHEALLDQDLRD